MEQGSCRTWRPTGRVVEGLVSSEFGRALMDGESDGGSEEGRHGRPEQPGCRRFCENRDAVHLLKPGQSLCCLPAVETAS
jgi:hypothetical protein